MLEIEGPVYPQLSSLWQILSYIDKHSNMPWSPQTHHNTMSRHRVDTETNA